MRFLSFYFLVQLSSVNEIRTGWKTDVFNNMIAQRNIPECDECRCFSIVYKNNSKTLDLMASNELARDTWVRGLQTLIDRAKGATAEDVYVELVAFNTRKNSLRRRVILVSG